jgi:ribosomal protein S18 acetylase RimI-like enzyme
MLQSEPVYRDYVVSCDRDVVRDLTASTGFFTPAEIDVAVELVTECLSKGEASGYNFLFAEVDSEPVGFSCYGPIPCTLSSYDLYWIVVGAGSHRQGIGKKLMRLTETMIKLSGGARVYAETSSRKQYDPTRKFYLSQGYRQEAFFLDFYAPGDGKIVYVKTL